MRWENFTVALLLVLLATVAATSQGSQDSAANFHNCRTGIASRCDPSLLTDAQRDTVRQATLSRNFHNCRAGIASRCDSSLLTDAQRDTVRQATLSRNFHNCRTGIASSCDSSLLTDAQQAAVTATRQPPTSSLAVPSTSAVREAEKVSAPGCAENGSCYGDISEATGRPKTVHVNGYYRRDGTYVRGHYRSRPSR